MLFGQSIFQSVVTRLKHERADDVPDETAESFRVRGLTTGFVATTADEPASIGTGTEAYFASLADFSEFSPEPDTAAPQAAPKALPLHLLRLSEAEIAEELAMTGEESETALNDKRRKFAKTNHPDGVAAEFRDNATTRMKIANLLIDRAIKQLAWR